MKPVLVMDGKEITIASIDFANGKVSKVSYFDDENKFITLFDKNHKLDGYESVEDLDSKVIIKNDFKSKLVQDIEEFLTDEEKFLDLENNEVADANRDLYSDPGKYRYYLDSSLRRQEQIGKVNGIADVLNLVKLSLGCKD